MTTISSSYVHHRIPPFPGFYARPKPRLNTCRVSDGIAHPSYGRRTTDTTPDLTIPGPACYAHPMTSALDTRSAGNGPIFPGTKS